DQLPSLEPRLGRALANLDGVACVRLVLLVVDVADGLPLQELAVLGMLDQAGNLHPTALGHLVPGHNADLNSLGHGSPCFVSFSFWRACFPLPLAPLESS